MKRDENDITRDILQKIRACEKEGKGSEGFGMLVEAAGETNGNIAITDDPKFGQNVLTNQIQQFRSAVESGAEFSKPNENKVEESPLIFMPRRGNLVFSGVIPCLNNLKWQFVLKTNTGNGCFIWGDGVIINRENLQILSKLYGYYVNWKESWISETADLDRIADKIING